MLRVVEHGLTGLPDGLEVIDGARTHRYAQAVDPGRALQRIGDGLGVAGYEVVTGRVDDRLVIVGRRSQFRWRWLATRLHTFVIAAVFPDATNRADLDRFSDQACAYAIAAKGGLPRGLQTGSAAIAVAVVADAGGDLPAWAAKARGRRFAALSYPVVVEAATGRVLHPRRIVLGALFGPHLRRVAETTVGRALTS